MKSAWTPLCCLVLAAALTACKSSAPAPTEGEAETTTADESPKAPPAPAAKPDVPAPPDVAAVPEDAEKSESGLAWKVLREGNGDKHPGKLDMVRVKYVGWTPDGEMFDRSDEGGEPLEIPMSNVVPGWAEGLQLMTAGEKHRFWMPGKLAFGEAKSDDPNVLPVRPRGMVVFDIELLGFDLGPQPPRATPEDVAEIPKNAKRSKSGLAWRVLQKGTGKAHPTAKSTVSINYIGWTTDGRMVSTSMALGKPASFVLGDSIPGWQEAIQMMVAGETRRLWIPENLAYAGRPGFPEGMVVYDMQLVDFKK